MIFLTEILWRSAVLIPNWLEILAVIRSISLRICHYASCLTRRNHTLSTLLSWHRSYYYPLFTEYHLKLVAFCRRVFEPIEVDVCCKVETTSTEALHFPGSLRSLMIPQQVKRPLAPYGAMDASSGQSTGWGHDCNV